MKILVTGGCGYIGRHVVNTLLWQGHDVQIATSDASRQKETSCPILPFDVFAERFDLYAAIGCPDLVINLAWQDAFDHMNLSHFDTVQKHIKFIHTMLRSGLKKIVSIGTAHEIGHYIGAVDETTPTNPISNYGIAKNYLRQVQNQLCQHYGAIGQWLRCYHITGDDEHNNSVFSKILKAALNGQKTFPLNDGEILLDFIDVIELGEMIVTISLQDKINGTINCCSGQPVSLKTKILEFIRQNKLDIEPQWGQFPFRTYDVRALWGDRTKLDSSLRI